MVQITESSTQGSPTQAAPKTSELGGSWKLWQNLAKQSEEFGHPDVFCKDIPKEAWVVSATVTWKNLKIQPYFEKLTHRQLRSGKVVTGGIITVKDSNCSFHLQLTANLILKNKMTKKQ